MQIIPFNAVSGDLTAKIIRDDGVSFLLHSRYHPRNEAQCWINEQLGGKMGGPVVVFGLGLGYHIEALARSGYSGKIIVLEGQPELVHLVSGRSNWEKPDNCDLLTVYNKKDYLNELERLITLVEEGASLLIHRTSIMALPEDWQDIKELLENYLMRLDTNRRFGRLARENWLQNRLLALNGLGLADLKEKWPDKPNLIVGAGPSLSESIQEVKNWAKYLNIICTGSSAAFLVRAGIIPDIQVFLDPQKKVINQLTAGTEKIDSVVFATVHSEVVVRLKGKVYWAWQRGFDWGAAGRPPYLFTGGSVAVAALSLSFFLNEQPALLCGVDLGYKGDLSHAEGTAHQGIKAVLKNMREVQAITGETMRTSRNLDYYRRRIEEMVAASGRIVYNLGTGAYIRGVQPVAWKQIKEILGWN